MSFREKSAWISFVLILVLFGFYFASLAWTPLSQMFWVFLNVVIALVVLEVVLHAIVAIRSPREARTPRDERERLIALKATRIGFAVLMMGAFGSIFATHFHIGMRGVAQCVLLAVVLAQLAKFGAEIIYFRRGA